MVTLERQRNTAWGLTWLAYASYYTGRKGFGAAKKSLHDQLGVSEATLGAIDTAYLLAYAFGQFVSGWAGDRIGARRLVGYGMLLSSVACALFGLSGQALVFGGLFALNGIAQSTGWPGTTRAMAEWTTPKNRGTVMAFWATCYQVGGFAATMAAGWLLGQYGWRGTFWGPAIWMALVALLVLRLLSSPPAGESHAAQVTENAASAVQSQPASRVEIARVEARRDAQRRVLRSPLLWCYGGSYFFIKFIRYALLFWLPYYLAKELHYSDKAAVYMSACFEVGGVLGVVGVGMISDRFRRVPRAIPAAASLAVLALLLLGYSLSSVSSDVGVGVSLGLIGAALFGPDALISGAAAQDVGGNEAAAMATGFVNGIGSIGAMIEGLVVPLISARYGWSALFPSLALGALGAALMLLPALRWAR